MEHLNYSIKTIFLTNYCSRNVGRATVNDSENEICELQLNAGRVPTNTPGKNMNPSLLPLLSAMVKELY